MGSRAPGVWTQHPKLLLQICATSPDCHPHASGNQRESTLHTESLVWPPRETKLSPSALWPQHVLLSKETRARRGPGHINSSDSECTVHSRHAGILKTFPGALRCLWPPLGRLCLYRTVSGAGWEPPHPHCTRKSSVHPWN